MAARKDFHPRCQVCTHDDRMTIDLALARGATVPVIVTKFPALSKDSLYRHYHRHIPQATLQRLKVKSLAGIIGKNLNVAELTDTENQSILAQIVALKSSLLGAISAAERADAGALFSSLCGRLTKLLEVEARILGQISTGSTTTITNYIASENFVAVRSALIAALHPYPDATKAVARALLALEAPKQIEVIDVTPILIADGEPSPAPDIAGTREGAPPPLAQATGEIVSAPHDLPVREVPAPLGGGK
jgi:hypothetical protein